MTTTFPYVHRHIIPFGDTDAAAMVYTPRFSDYCMEAAEVWFRDYIDFDWYRINTEIGMGTPVVHMEIDFLAELKAGDKLRVEVQVAKTGRSSVALTFKGVRERTGEVGQVHTFNGRFIFCITSIKEGGAVSIPAPQREFINIYRAQSKLVS